MLHKLIEIISIPPAQPFQPGQRVVYIGTRTAWKEAVLEESTINESYPVGITHGTLIETFTAEGYLVSAGKDSGTYRVLLTLDEAIALGWHRELPEGAILEDCPDGYYAVECINACFCDGCAFWGNRCPDPITCATDTRADKKDVIFKKLP